jgi:hypothetical protein
MNTSQKLLSTSEHESEFMNTSEHESEIHGHEPKILEPNENEYKNDLI